MDTKFELSELLSLKHHLECITQSSTLFKLCCLRGWSYCSFDLDLLVDLVNDFIDNFKND